MRLLALLIVVFLESEHHHFGIVFNAVYDMFFLCARLDQFAELYARKVGVSAPVLNKTLWGDFYLDAKAKTVRKGAQVSTFLLPPNANAFVDDLCMWHLTRPYCHNFVVPNRYDSGTRKYNQ